VWCSGKGAERAGARGTPGDERAEPRASPLAEVRASASGWRLDGALVPRQGTVSAGSSAGERGNLRVCIARARAAQSRGVLSMEISWAPVMYVIGLARACSLGLAALLRYGCADRARARAAAGSHGRARAAAAGRSGREVGWWGARARAGGCEIRAGAPRVRRAPATLTLQLVQIGQNPVSR
jgi:hypothetical protein